MHQSLMGRSVTSQTPFALHEPARDPVAHKLGHAPLLPVSHGVGCVPSARAWRLAQGFKACVDVGLAALLLLALLPAMLLLAAVIRRDGGPALFAHERLGMHGRRFRCLKFRTMVVNADAVLREALARDPAAAAEWALHRKLRQDPRVTPVGRLLRSCSLDELPQLLNVLRRDMSLVGPRPIVEQEVARYADAISRYYAMRPGITGLWQVSGRSDVSYDRRVELDSFYAANWTLRLDAAIIGRTLPAVLRRKGAR